MALDHFGVIVASLWGDFGVMWGHIGHMEVPLGHFGVSLGLLWPHFGSIVWLLLGYEGGFGGLAR